MTETNIKNSQNRKIAFISCVNNELMYEECLYYINRLIVPEGYTVEIYAIRGATSMTSGYNQGMKSSDAKYKVYLHQDVTILNPYFIFDMLQIFDSDETIGMIGMVGNPTLPADGVPWHGERVGSLYAFDIENTEYEKDMYKIKDGLYNCETIDGLLMITGKDILWREDLFCGFDFYDVSQCAEFRKAGYRVVVPEQKSPWTAHDDGVMNLLNGYNKYRKIFIDEYMKTE